MSAEHPDHVLNSSHHFPPPFSDGVAVLSLVLLGCLHLVLQADNNTLCLICPCFVTPIIGSYIHRQHLVLVFDHACLLLSISSPAMEPLSFAISWQLDKLLWPCFCLLVAQSYRDVHIHFSVNKSIVILASLFVKKKIIIIEYPMWLS